LDKEVQSYEKLSYVDPTDTKGKMALENELDYGDYLLLSGLRVGLCLRTIESLNPDQINSNQMKAFCEEKNFQRAVMYCEKCMELSPDSDKSLAIARSNFFLAQLYGALDSKNHEYLLFLIEKVSQTKDGKSWNDNVSVPESLLNEELCSYFSRELTPVQKYGKAAGTAYSRLLETANYSEDQWLRLLEQHKQLYSLLQVYHCRRAELCEFLYKKVDRNSEIIKQRDPWKWAAFMYAEGERSQSMLYQLLDSDKISRSFKWSFDASIGFKTGMQNVHRALPPRGVFVQYSNLVENGRAFIIYVCDTVRCQLHACMQVFNLDYST
jgi:tetratricopeptide (TPR) repeat protein